MKKSVLPVFICVIALLFPSFVLGQFGMGCCPVGGTGASGMSCVTVGNVSFVPWLGFGYQSLGLNLNFPFRGGLFEGLDVSLKNNALWIGSLGVDVAYGQRLRFYAAADTNLFVGNAGSLSTNTDRFWGWAGASGLNNVPVTGFNWQGTQQRWWELNLGGLYCLTDDVAILVGYKCDSFTEKLDSKRDFFDNSNGDIENYYSDLNFRGWK